MWPRSVVLQGCQETALAHSVIGFAEVQKNQEEWVLIDASQILIKFELHYGCPCSPPGTEAMDDVMEDDTLPHMGVNNCFYHLPQCIQKAPGVGVAFGDED